ncbi:MAG: nickel-dependent hydrogenase large subunit [Sulfuritalea sp.]|nr:nickel-dependent hydrogenase large subunit [Sulfuritalea sp.]
MSAGIDPGCVRLKLACAHGRVAAVEVSSERPVVAQALRGRSAGQAVSLVPLLFALCGKAQGRAAQLALAAARGRACEAQVDPDIEREALREHLWRWLLDLPPLLGAAAMQFEFVEAMRWLSGGQRAELAAFLAGPRIEELVWHLREVEDVGDAGTQLLPAFDARGSLASIARLDADFCRHPHWLGAAAETGAFARRGRGEGLAAGALAMRWLARLAELREWTVGGSIVGVGGTASAIPLEAGRGRALVETARGLLMHEIVLDGERIADYFIVAPTEWNFHPQGPLAGWLLGRDAGDRDALEKFAARAVAALDPCVRWELEWL